MINNMEYVQTHLPALMCKLLNTEEFSRAAENAQCPNAKKSLMDSAMTRVTNKINEIFQTKVRLYSTRRNKICILNKQSYIVFHGSV
jgi:hypothetical protein